MNLDADMMSVYARLAAAWRRENLCPHRKRPGHCMHCRCEASVPVWNDRTGENAVICGAPFAQERECCGMVCDGCWEEVR